MCSVLVLAHGLLFRHIDEIKDRFMCSVHVWRSCFGSRIIVSNSAH